MKKTNWWKWGILIAAIIAAFFIGNCNGRQSILKSTGVDTIVVTKTDTMHTTPEPTLEFPPDTVTKWMKPDVVTLHDTLEIDVFHPRPVTDTIKELKRLQGIELAYNRKVPYKDSAYSKDSSLKAIVWDTVQRNRLGRRTWVVSRTDTSINKTIMLKPSKPLVLSVTTSLMGNAKKPFYGQGAGFQLKLPNDETYEAGLYRVPGEWMIEVKKSWPIRIGKRK